MSYVYLTVALSGLNYLSKHFAIPSGKILSPRLSRMLDGLMIASEELAFGWKRIICEKPIPFVLY